MLGPKYPPCDAFFLLAKVGAALVWFWSRVLPAALFSSDSTRPLRVGHPCGFCKWARILDTSSWRPSFVLTTSTALCKRSILSLAPNIYPFLFEPFIKTIFCHSIMNLFPTASLFSPLTQTPPPLP